MGNVPAAVAEGARRATGATAARAATEHPSPLPAEAPARRGRRQVSRFYLASPAAQEVLRPGPALPVRTRWPASAGPSSCAAAERA